MVWYAKVWYGTVWEQESVEGTTHGASGRWCIFNPGRPGHGGTSGQASLRLLMKLVHQTTSGKLPRENKIFLLFLSIPAWVLMQSIGPGMRGNTS